MPMTVRVNDAKIRKALKALSPAQTKKALNSTGNALLRRQFQRIEQGKGQSGKPMPLYSEEYEEVRRDAGRAIDRRNLQFTGRMMQARKVLKADGRGVLLGWKAGTAGASKAAGNQRRTPFTGATRKENAFAIAFLRKLLLRMVKSGSGGGSAGQAAAGPVPSSPAR